jgi:carboxypeptidase C (cathepsin A)
MNETSGQPMLVENPNSWNNFSNVLYVDSPIGTGYSFPRAEDVEFSPRVYSIDYAVSDFVHFMKGFLDFHT